MSLSDISAGLQAAVDWTFTDAVLRQATGSKVSDGAGGWTIGPGDVACRAKINRKRSYNPDRGTFTEVQILILTGSLTVEPQSQNAIQFGALPWNAARETFKLGEVQRDGIGSHFICQVV